MTFRHLHDSASGKSQIWQVSSRKHGNILGEVRWFAQWRQYTFQPGMATVFNPACLADIEKVLIALGVRHKDSSGLA